MNESDLIQHIDLLHTTQLGKIRVLRNLSLGEIDVVQWCVEKIQSEHAKIVRKGKNWYITIDGCIITVNAHSYTIITAHKKRMSE